MQFNLMKAECEPSLCRIAMALVGIGGLFPVAVADVPVPDAGIYKDAIYWYNGAVDADGDGNLSTTAGAELRDAFHAGDATHALSQGYQITAAGNEAAIQIVRETVGGTANAPCLKGYHSPQGDGSFWPGNVYLGDVAPFTFSYTNSYTIVTRFKWFGYLGGATYTQMGSIGYGWASPIGTGLCFGFHNWQEKGVPYVWLSFGGADIDQSSWYAGTNKWTNMAIVMDGANKKVTVYMENANNGDISVRTSDYPSAAATTKTKPKSDISVLGNGKTASPTTNANSLKGFNGMMHHFAVFGRTMTLDEVKKAFEWPRKSVNWQIGYENGSSQEFAGLSTSSSFTCRSDAEIGFPAKLSPSGRSQQTVVFPFDSTHAMDAKTFPLRAQAIVCKLAPDSGFGTVSATVNGTPVGSASARARGCLTYFVPVEIMRESNQLTLTAESGSVTFDTIYGGGDWQIGLCNDSCFNDGFAAGYYPEYVVGTPWSLFTRCLTGPGNGSRLTIAVKTVLTAEQVEYFKWSVETRLKKHDGVPVDAIRVNGKEVVEASLSNWSFNTVSANIPRELLTAGTNTIELVRKSNTSSSSNDYDEIDYVRLSPWKHRPHYGGLSLIVK